MPTPTPVPTPTPGPLHPSAEIDRQILEELYHSTNGDTWTNNENWLTDQPLDEWYGVKADTYTDRVLKLDLADSGLSGELPENLWFLTELTDLYLEGNSLTEKYPGPFPQIRDQNPN